MDFFISLKFQLNAVRLFITSIREGEKDPKELLKNHRMEIESSPVSIKLRNKLTDLFDIDCCNQRFESATGKMLKCKNDFIQIFLTDKIIEIIALKY